VHAGKKKEFENEKSFVRVPVIFWPKGSKLVGVSAARIASLALTPPLSTLPRGSPHQHEAACVDMGPESRPGFCRRQPIASWPESPDPGHQSHTKSWHLHGMPFSASIPVNRGTPTMSAHGPLPHTFLLPPRNKKSTEKEKKSTTQATASVTTLVFPQYLLPLSTPLHCGLS
jgi:hypothetical protein